MTNVYTFTDTTVTGWSGPNSIDKQITDVNSGVSGITAISDAAFAAFNGYTFNLTGLDFPITLTTIGNNSYSDATGITGPLNLSTLTNLTTLNSSAFSECNQLSSLTLPTSLTVLGSGAFSNCFGLTGSLTLVGLTGLTRIRFNTFDGCSNLTSLTLPNSLTTLESSAFFNCSGLTGALDLDGLTSLVSIGNSAFSGCSQLNVLTLPISLTTLDLGAFSNCSGLTGALDLDGLTSLTSLGTQAFSGCSQLNALTLPISLITIGSSAFLDCPGLAGSLDLDGLTNLVSIGNGAFVSCSQLISLTLPPSLTSLGSQVFAGCSQLNGTLDLAGLTSLTSLKSQAFIACSELDTLTLPSSLTTIGTQTFAGCDFTSVYFQSGCALQTNSFSSSSAILYSYNNTFTVGSATETFSPTVNPLSTFFSTWRLYDYPYPTTTTKFGVDNYPFTLTFTPGAVEFYTYSPTDPGQTYTITTNGSYSNLSYSYSNNLVTFTLNIQSGTLLTLTKSGIGYDMILINNMTNVYTSIGTTITGWSGPNSIDKQITDLDSGVSGITAIDDFAFFNKGYTFNLTGLDFPITLTTIGYSAYQSATGITGPLHLSSLTNLTTLFADCFAECNQLTSLTLPTSLTSLGGATFFNCSGLTGNLDLDGLTSLNSIDFQAFQGCFNLTSLTLPTSLTSLGGATFFNCSGLTSVYFQAGCTIPNTAFSLATNAIVYSYADTFTVGTTTETFSPTVNPLTSFFTNFRLYDYPYPDMNTTYSPGNTGPFVLFSNSSTFSFFTYSLVVTSYTVLFFDSNSNPITVNTPTLSYSNDLVTFTVSTPFNVAKLTLNGNDMMVVFQTVIDGVTYTISGSTASAISYNGSLLNIVIPSTITIGANNFTVTSIAPNAFAGAIFVYITIPNSVTSIGTSAFEGGDFSFVIIEDGPNTVTINENAFYNSQIISIIIPNSVTSIGNQAFYFCQNLTSVAIRRGNNSLTIGDSVFGNTSLTKINIPNSVISIGTSAFGSSGLTSLTIEDGPNTVTIGNSAFAGTGLTTIRIPNSVTLIGPGAFDNCISLTSIIIEDGLNPVTIDSAAFRNGQMVSITIPQSVISIGLEAFFQTTLESVTINGATTLDISFSNVKNLCVKGDNNLYVSSFPNLELLVYNQEYSNGFGIPQSVPFNPNASVELSGTSLIIDKVFVNVLPVLQGKYNTDIISNNFFNQVTFPLTINPSKSYLFDFTISYGTLTVLNVPISIIQDSSILSIVTDILPEDTSTWTNYNLFVFEQLVNTLPRLVSIPKLPESAFIEVSPHYSNITTIYAVPYQSTLDISQYVFGTTVLLLLSTYPNSIDIGVVLQSDGTRSYISTILFLLGTSITLGNYKIRLVANSSSNITLENVESPVVPVSNICFPAGTPVLTDQGYVPIDKITRHTLNKKPIQLIKTTHVDNFLICFEKDALEKNIPFQRTLISKDHIVYYKEFSGKAIDFIPYFCGVFKVAYKGDIIYNVLVDVHTKITVNNMICETLNPKKQNPNKIINRKKENMGRSMAFR